VLIGHSFGRLVSKSLVVKLKRKSTIRNRINSKLACTCSLLFVQCLLQNQGKHRRIKENTLEQIEKNREKKINDKKKKQSKEEVKLGNMAKNK
jgi:cell division protein ZapA (FtsZ GTPase activity inhibitor)